ncbi:PhzF family phenazine biosynthesis protein [Glutamicibacter uratoxydans]|nr:PhzF family phenazine biosynthesis protein [Glutamicibacter uratoxydans]
MSSTFAYQQVDVFAPTAFNGNGLAVVFDADDLSDDQMQRFAQWINMAETAFFVEPTDEEADYAIRIFTPTTELPFAGHPTLGAAHAWLAAGGEPGPSGHLVQQCQGGLIRLRVEREASEEHSARIAFLAPPLTRSGPLEPDVLQWAIAGLGLHPDDVVDHAWLANGPQPAGLVLRDADLVLAIEPDYEALEGLEVGVIGPYTASSVSFGTWQPRESVMPRISGTREELRPLDSSDLERSEERFGSVVLQPPADFEVRNFVPGEAVPEDPATGSLNAAFGIWLTESGYAPQRYTVRQGTRVGRNAILHVEADDQGVWVSGDIVTRVNGTVSFD